MTQHHTNNRRQDGFTLIEIMVVVIIIGILAAIVAPNVIGRVDDARITAAKSDIATIEGALKMYRLDNFSYPQTQQGLEALIVAPNDPSIKNWNPNGYIARLPKDPWGNAYQYLNPGSHGTVDIYSFGADGKPGGAEEAADIGNWEPDQLLMLGGSDRDNYQAAFELLKKQHYEPAALAFLQFLATFPGSELADNAQYWLAESHYVTQQFTKALNNFEIVIAKYPNSRKVPDALLKVGYCNYELKSWTAARASLMRVQAEYPETTAARLAGQRLQRLDAEGV